MRPLSLVNQDISLAKRAEGWQLEKARFATESGTKDAIHQAARESLLQKYTARFRWIAICESCLENRIDLQKILVTEKIFGKSILYRLVESEDWLSCAVINFMIADGIYDDGRVTKLNDTIFIDFEQDKILKGFRSYKGGAWYGGSFLNHQRHGHGVFCNPAFTYYGDDPSEK